MCLPYNNEMNYDNRLVMQNYTKLYCDKGFYVLLFCD